MAAAGGGALEGGRYLPSWSDVMRGNFDELCGRIELGPDMVQRAWRVYNKQIVVICDDSGSMGTPLAKTFLPPKPVPVTRWDELKAFMEYVIRIGAVMSDGIIVKFLNRQSPADVIRTPEQLAPYLAANPSGGTPLIGSLQWVFSTFRPAVSEKDLLLIICTDGAPSDGNPKDVKKVLTSRPDLKRSFVNFLVCTDNDEDVAYLDKIDRTVKNVDVTDDYFTERAQVHKKRGASFKFSLGDWAMKCVIGAADPALDAMDEGGCSVM